MSLDFPNAPTTNQIFQNWQWDGVKWVAIGAPAIRSGARVLIQSQSPTAGQTFVTFTGAGIGDGSYDEYEIHCLNMMPTTEASFALQMSNDGGTTWHTGTSDYWTAYHLISSGNVSSVYGAASSFIGLNTNGQPAPVNNNVWIKLAGLSLTNAFKTVTFESVGQNSSGATTGNGGGALQVAAGAVNGLRFYYYNSTFAHGTINLYEIAR